MVADSQYVNMTQAASLLGVSRVTVWRWVRDGRLRATRLGHRTVRIHRADIERLLARPLALLPGGESPDDAPPRLDWSRIDANAHIVQFYDSETYINDAVANYVERALRAGDAAIALSTAERRAAVMRRLEAIDMDAAALSAAGQLVLLDADTAMRQIVVDGMPDRDRFEEVVGSIVERAARRGGDVRVFGEVVALLVEAGNVAAALRLEELWNELRQRLSFALFCAYPMRQIAGEGHLQAVCDAHTHVVPTESYSALISDDDRRRTIVGLQQKAERLAAEIAERERAEERLRAALDAERAAREELEAALRLRDEFLSIAAHELKTPLTGLAGHTQLVLRQLQREGELPPERLRRALEMIGTQAGKLHQLLNQLLDISRLESGKLAIQRQETDLSTLVAQVVEIVQAASGSHTIELAASARVSVSLDPLRFEQVVTNLLDNAVKYSPAGSRIEVTLARSPMGDVELAVRDRGEGIPPAERGQIFDRFYQAPHNRDHSGLGLGLFISRQIVELHGGTISAEFPADGGTRFVVLVPSAADTPAAIAADG